ncbi:MAG: hypothetical protein H0A75_08440 [Candidatus Methanofishera endochildressiae]|uniref:Uncharacterized protein n=1 Tax=Candidatus Methanofishera endochildressiae TaxID=2738884 RepID=A0A7Z0MQA9_9GAMM|nr:hypothetical protein [Candidatus Methanofishera endochildressiae]
MSSTRIGISASAGGLVVLSVICKLVFLPSAGGLVVLGCVIYPVVGIYTSAGGLIVLGCHLPSSQYFYSAGG